MDVYRRYFRVETGPLIEALNKCDADKDAARDAARELSDSFGADGYAYWPDGRGVAGFQFRVEPDMKAWKDAKLDGNPSHYLPRKSTTAGKAIQRQVDALPAFKDHQEVIKSVGLYCEPTMCTGNSMARSILRYWDGKVAFVSMPWADVDPEELAEYKKEKEAGKRGDMNLDHLLYTPHESMVEVKGWEVDKYIAESEKEGDE
jgi:hypothetical protein